MAFRSAKNWQSMVAILGGRRSVSSSTTPKMKPMSSTIEAHSDSMSSRMKNLKKAEYAPVYMVWGMVSVALMVGTHTAYQQLARSPAVNINKKRRGNVPEVSDPDRTLKSSTKFIDGSFLRKVAHIQDSNPTLHDTAHPNPFSATRNAETLKTVGVDPSKRR